MPGWQGSNRRATLPRGWARLRAVVLIRDKHRCVEPDCGRPANHVDHIVPEHLGGSNEPSNLQSLCSDCHAKKSSSEGGRARAARAGSIKRAAEPHPGLKG